MHIWSRSLNLFQNCSNRSVLLDMKTHTTSLSIRYLAIKKWDQMRYQLRPCVTRPLRKHSIHVKRIIGHLWLNFLDELIFTLKLCNLKVKPELLSSIKLWKQKALKGIRSIFIMIPRAAFLSKLCWTSAFDLNSTNMVKIWIM